MGALQDFERRLEGAVDGFFARIFRSGIQPIELAKAIQRYAEDNQHVTADGVVVPNVYRVTVGPKDHDRLQGYGASLPRELGEMVVTTAADRGWSLRGPVKVRVDVDDDVRLGRYRMAGRIEAAGTAAAHAGAPASRQAAPPPPRTRADRGPAAPPATAPPPAAAAAVPSAGPSTDQGTGELHAPDEGIDRTQVISGGPTSRYSLIVRSGPAAGARAQLGAQRLTAGRLRSCDLVIEDTTVSREHAAFVRRGTAWWVIDLGSTNGTTVNGKRAAEHPIAPGDRIELGDAVVELVET